MSRVSLIPRSTKAQVFPLVDLRPLGAPVFHYAVRVDELWINGGRYRPSDGVVKPIYAVFDSGVTGCLVSKKLFYDSAFQFGTYESHVRVRDENGTRNSIGKYFPFTTFRRLIAHTRLKLSFLSLRHVVTDLHRAVFVSGYTG